MRQALAAGPNQTHKAREATEAATAAPQQALLSNLCFCMSALCLSTPALCLSAPAFCLSTGTPLSALRAEGGGIGFRTNGPIVILTNLPIVWDHQPHGGGRSKTFSAKIG